MKPFDQTLIDPRESILQQTLAEAADSLGVAGKGSKPRLPWPPKNLAGFLAELTRTPVGMQKWEGRKSGSFVPTVGAAWWTDTPGRRHLRIRADRVPDWFRKTDFLWGVNVPSTPLFLVYPQAGLLSLCAGKKIELVLCSCGRMGSPSEVGWTGTQCSGCFSSPRGKGKAAERWPAPRFLSPRGNSTTTLDAMPFTPDGQGLVASTHTHLTQLTWWDVPALTRRKGGIELPDNSHVAVGFTRKDELIITSPYVGVWLCDATTAETSRHWDLAGDTASGFAVSEGGERFLAARGSGLYSWKPQTEECRQLSTTWFSRLASSADGRHVAGREFRTSRLVFLNGEDGEERGSLEMEPDTDYQLAFSPDGKTVAVAIAGPFRHERRWLQGTVLLFDFPNAGPRAVLAAAMPHEDLCPVFSPDGRWLLTVGDSGLARVWDPVSAQQVTTLTWPGAENALPPVWSSDGSMFLTGDRFQGKVRLWPWELFQRAIALAGSEGKGDASIFHV